MVQHLEELNSVYLHSMVKITRLEESKKMSSLICLQRIHTGAKPFKCEICGRAFRQPGNLTRHRLTHTSVKPYVCPTCNKAFNRASNLNTHMRTHANYRPFTCTWCGKGFNQKVDLKIHSYTHTGKVRRQNIHYLFINK